MWLLTFQIKSYILEEDFWGSSCLIYELSSTKLRSRESEPYLYIVLQIRIPTQRVTDLDVFSASHMCMQSETMATSKSLISRVEVKGKICLMSIFFWKENLYIII